MSILTLMLIIVVLGILLWAAKKYLPIDDSIKQILTIVVVVVIVLLCLSAFGVLDYLQGYRVPRMNR